MSNKKNNLKYAKKLKDEFSAFEQVFNSHIEKVKKEHNKVLLQKMSELISNIASNENLDEIYLREKYLNLKEMNEMSKKYPSIKHQYVHSLKLYINDVNNNEHLIIPKQNMAFNKWFDFEPEEKYLNCIFEREKKD